MIRMLDPLLHPPTKVGEVDDGERKKIKDREHVIVGVGVSIVTRIESVLIVSYGITE